MTLSVFTLTRRPGAPGPLPLFAWKVPAGFPSPAEDYAQGRLDLNDYLVEHEAATFYVRVEGHSMTGAGILDGATAGSTVSLLTLSGGNELASSDRF